MRRLATTLRTTRSFASAPTTPRIAICGAGVSGLTLAGILSNGTRDVQLTVFEATGAANLPPLRAGEAIMFARKEAFHVERLKPPMNTRKMVEARGRGPL
jgi:hypothetical protein